MAEDDCTAGRVVALSGGVGGSKLADGLSRVVPAGRLAVVANTGDDFEHLGLSICPDLDTLLYTLGGLADPDRGWGRKDETWTFMQALGALGGESWFQLGDGDLAMHVERTRRLAAGETLSMIMDAFRRRLGIASRLWPMSDNPVRTRIRVAEGWIAFQDYFVRRRAGPEIREIAFSGAEDSRPHDDFLSALRDPDLRAVVICPSNPLISIGPILAVPGVRDAIAACRAPVVAVSPIIGGSAVKGPTAKMIVELGGVPDAIDAARRYAGLLDGYIIDTGDATLASMAPVPVEIAPTLMVTPEDRERLAKVVLSFADRLSAGTRKRQSDRSHP